MSKLLDTLQTKSMDTDECLLDLATQFSAHAEDTQAFVWDRLYEINVAALKHPSHYLKEQAAAIRHEFSKKRVRKVHFRN